MDIAITMDGRVFDSTISGFWAGVVGAGSDAAARSATGTTRTTTTTTTGFVWPRPRFSTGDLRVPPELPGGRNAFRDEGLKNGRACSRPRRVRVTSCPAGQITTASPPGFRPWGEALSQNDIDRRGAAIGLGLVIPRNDPSPDCRALSGPKGQCVWETTFRPKWRSYPRRIAPTTTPAW
jgi:hypothetical protein